MMAQALLSMGIQCVSGRRQEDSIQISPTGTGHLKSPVPRTSLSGNPPSPTLQGSLLENPPKAVCVERPRNGSLRPE